jgi:two-component system chemotaxis response regulator CheY
MAVTALIVDDSAVSRETIGRCLRQAGCTVAGEAKNALEGLDLFRRFRPNLVTLDLMMPRTFRLDGTTLLREMKKEMPEVAVIVVSVLPFEKIRRQLLEAGALAYIVKPLNDRSFEPVRQQLAQLFPELGAAHA